MNTKTLQTIDPDFLESFFSHVKSNLKQDKPDLSKLLALDGPFLATLFQDVSDASSVITGLDKLKILDNFLKLLSRTVKEGLRRVRLGVLPVINRRGFLSLPVEIVAKIFERACDEDTHTCKNLTLVSKDFRNIAIKVPRLWTHLTASKNPKHYLERSKSVDIDVVLNCDDFFAPGITPSRARLFFHMAESHASRWRSLSLAGFRKSFRNVFSDLCKISPADTFLALETLHIDYQDDIPIDDELNVAEKEQDPDKNLRHFFSTWRMPNLRTVQVVNVIPLLPLVSITCLRLKLGTYEYEESTTWNMREVISLLRSLHSLRELSIHLSKVLFSSVEDMHVELPLLKTLELHTELMDETYTTGSILKAISAPNVSKLNVRINSCVLDDLEMQLEDLFPEDNLRWPRLESLDFELELNEDGYVSDGTLDIIFTRLPKIQHLRMSCEGIEHPSTLNVHKRERQQLPYPPLRTLELKNCSYFDTSFFFSIKDIIKAPEFASLKIEECPLIEKGIVRELMPDDKVLEWKLSAKGANELRLRLAHIKEERNGWLS